MVDRVHGYAFSGESVSKDMEFFTVQTTLNVTPTGVIADAARVNPTATYPFTFNGTTYANVGEYNAAKTQQARFDALVKAMSTRAQPVIIGSVTSEDQTAPVAGLPVTDASSGATVTVYSVVMAVEHGNVWDGNDMGDLLNGVEGFVYTTPTTNNNVSVTKAETL